MNMKGKLMYLMTLQKRLLLIKIVFHISLKIGNTDCINEDEIIPYEDTEKLVLEIKKIMETIRQKEENTI